MWASPIKGAVWVAIEMGCTPLIVLSVLGMLFTYLEARIIRAYREDVSLYSELYGSYNVAVAGSIVMYDRMTKMWRREATEHTMYKKKAIEKLIKIYRFILPRAPLHSPTRPADESTRSLASLQTQ